MKSVIKKICVIVVIGLVAVTLSNYFLGTPEERYHRRFQQLTPGMTKDEVFRRLREPHCRQDGDDYGHYQTSMSPYPGAILLFSDGKLQRVLEAKSSDLRRC